MWNESVEKIHPSSFRVFDKRDPDGAFYSIPFLGGLPKRIFGYLGSCFTLSPDGSRLFLSRGNSFVDVVLIKNFR
jgi:hypothetical protein